MSFAPTVASLASDVRRQRDQRRALGLTVSEDERRALAAIVFAEASPASGSISDEMRAIAWCVRNRVDHLATPAGKSDAKWWGGPTYRKVIEFQSQFEGWLGTRYQTFPADPKQVQSPADREFARLCYAVADEVMNASAPPSPGYPPADFPYVYFQKGKTNPSPQRATKSPTKIGNHWFWSFARPGGR